MGSFLKSQWFDSLTFRFRGYEASPHHSHPAPCLFVCLFVLSADWFLERSFLLCHRSELFLSELLVFSCVLCTEGAVLNSQATEILEALTLRSEAIRVSESHQAPSSSLMPRAHLSCLPNSSISPETRLSARSPIHLLPFVSGTDSNWSQRGWQTNAFQ